MFLYSFEKGKIKTNVHFNFTAVIICMETEKNYPKKVYVRDIMICCFSQFADNLCHLLMCSSAKKYFGNPVSKNKHIHVCLNSLNNSSIGVTSLYMIKKVNDYRLGVTLLLPLVQAQLEQLCEPAFSSDLVILHVLSGSTDGFLTAATGLLVDAGESSSYSMLICFQSLFLNGCK